LADPVTLYTPGELATNRRCGSASTHGKPTKTQLRKSYLEKRDGLNAITRARDSAIIRHRVVHHPEWRIAETILTYVSIRSEVETLKLIQERSRRKNAWSFQ